MTMMEAEPVVHKKKKKKNKEHPAGEVPQLSNTYQACEEISLLKKKKKKKDKKNDIRAEGDAAERKTKKKRKREGEEADVTLVVRAETVQSIPQEQEVTKKKRKKRRFEETERPAQSQSCPKESDVTLTPAPTNDEAAQQKSAKHKAKRQRKTSPAAHLHPDEMPNEGPTLDIDEGVLQELREYLPHHKLNDDVVVRKIINYDLPRFRELKEKGIPVRSGRFTVAENKRLKANVREFLALSGIESDTKLFLPHRFPDEKNSIMKQRRKLRFIHQLCAGIPRTWTTILCRAKKMCNRENYMGRFTEDENKMLTKLHTLHSSNWSTISNMMGRSEHSLQKRFNMMSSGSGVWEEEELRTLLTNVRQQLLERATPDRDGNIGSAVIRKVDLYKQLPWMTLSEKVKTRSWLQCREKWMGYLTNKMTIGGVIKGRKILEGQIQLIKTINEMVVEDVADIVWDDLTHLFGNTHPDYLQMRFYQLKVAYVPRWNTMEDFCDIIDYLYEKTLPLLEEELKNCPEEEEPTEERDSYKLSEIFPDL
ncbi:transcription termination factor 1-like [Engraulis encrasicolus]|uniref:transcription termination factor 1-like n=1 Tax=Engraulis encrasicolus TaxID=184585 RepID=UPI002FCFE250